MLNSSSSFFFLSSSVISCFGLLKTYTCGYAEIIVCSVNYLLRHGCKFLPLRALVPPKKLLLHVCLTRPQSIAHAQVRTATTTMKWWLLCVVSLISVVIFEVEAVDKLQIGVKKRVDDCSIRSKKGDRLHMHYTVGVAVMCGG